MRKNVNPSEYSYEFPYAKLYYSSFHKVEIADDTEELDQNTLKVGDFNFLPLIQDRATLKS